MMKSLSKETLLSRGSDLERRAENAFTHPLKCPGCPEDESLTCDLAPGVES